MNPISTVEPAPAELAPSKAQKRWHAGTLTYTSGGLLVLFCWLLWGDFAWSLKERSVGSVVQLMLKKFEASDMVVGLLLGSLPGAITMLLGPIVACKSDRHRGHWGRRIPFLLVSTPVAALAMIALAFSPPAAQALHQMLGASSPGANVLTIAVFGLFWTIFEFATITANAVFGGLINDVVPQPVLGRFYAMFRALSLIAGILFNYYLLGKAEQHYVWIFVGIGLLYGIGFTSMCLKVKEGEYQPPPPAQPASMAGFFKGARVYFKECYGNPYYIWAFSAITLSWLSFSPINLFSVFFAKSVELDMDLYGKCIALTFLISLGLSYFIGSLADRFHPLRVGLVIQAIYCIATLLGGMFARDASSFAIAVVAHGVLSGAWMTGTASLALKLFPKAKFAQFASAMGILSSSAGLLMAPAIGSLLDFTNHTYRYTYLASFCLSTLALLSGVVLYRKFMALGGPSQYTAPE